MPVWDVSPTKLAPSTWGRIHFMSRVYQITGMDVLWLASAAAHESHEYTHAIWCMIQRLMGNRMPTLVDEVAAFSAPVNPLYQFEISHFASGQILPLPPAGPGGIPPRVRNTAVWNGMCLSRGTTRRLQVDPNGPINQRTGRVMGMKPASRQANWARLRQAAGGDDRAWVACTGGRESRCREAAFQICTARWGNPIPGWDDFAMTAESETFRNVRIEGVSGSQRQSLLNEVIAGNPNRVGASFRGSEAFRYRRTRLLRENMGEIVWIECDGRDTRSVTPVSMLVPGSVSGEVLSISGRVSQDWNAQFVSAPTLQTASSTQSTSTSPATGEIVPSTQEGLAPTAQVPEGSSAYSDQQQTASGSISLNGGLPNRAAIVTSVRSWADHMVGQLNQGPGGRRS